MPPKLQRIRKDNNKNNDDTVSSATSTNVLATNDEDREDEGTKRKRKKKKVANAVSSSSSSSNVSNPPINKKKRKQREIIDLTEEEIRAICDSAETNAEDTVSKRIEQSTKDTYDGIIRYIESVCEEFIPGALTVNVENDGIESKTLAIPMEFKYLKIFLGIMGAERKDGTLKAMKTIDSYINALKNLYKDKNQEFTKEDKKLLLDFTEGHKRKVAKKKDSGVMKNFEGKAPIAHQTYCAICKLAMFAATARSIISAFVHIFMILCWNLFARSISVSDLRMCHLSWSNDALVVDLSRHKADQTGEKITPKHVFANPFEPYACPILALGLYLFSYSFRINEDDKTKLFVKDPYHIFVKWFEQALQSVSNLGYSIEDFGTHSFRKGVTTYCSGFLGGPSVIAIFLRAGWTLGQVQDRYIGYSDGADQLCGRVACGLNFQNGEEFQVLPPCFKDNGLVLSPEQWEFVAPGYSEFPQCFKTVMPFLLASVVYHYDSFIMVKKDDGTLANISPFHPILNSPLFRSGLIQQHLQQQLLPLNKSGSCSISGMKASGIPPHVADNVLIRNVQAKFDALESKIDQYHKEMFTELPKNVGNHITEEFIVEGVQQMSKSQLTVILNDHVRSSVKAALEEYKLVHPQLDGTTHHETRDMNAVQQGIEYFMQTTTGYYLWSWDSRLDRPVPKDFTMPRGNVQTLCDLFMFGIESKHIMPFRLVSCDRLQKPDRTYFSRGKTVFGAVVQEAITLSKLVSDEEVASLTPAQWIPIFGESYRSLLNKIKTPKMTSKAELISYLSVFNYYTKYLKSLALDQE